MAKNHVLILLDAIEMTDSVVNDLTLLKGGYQTITAIAKGMKKASAAQRRNAVFYLGAIQDKKSDRLLSQILIRSNDEKLRLTALFALGKIGTKTASEALAQVLKKPKAGPAEITYALQFLGQIGSKEEIEAIEGLKKRLPLFAERADRAAAEIQRRLF